MIRKSLYGSCAGVVLAVGWLLGLSQLGAAGPGDGPVLKAEPAVVQPAPRDGAGDRQVGVVGACCFPDGGCFEIPALACADSGGVFQGIGTLCTPTLCPPPPPPIICDCPGEMNGDGILNGADIQQFVGCLVAAGGGPPPGCECADTNGDGLIDLPDVLNFVNVLLAGAPCPVFTTMSFATSAQVTINMINPPLGPIVLNLDSTATDNTTVRLEAPPYTTGQPIPTELIALDLTGVDPMLGGVQMQMNPVFPSQGMVNNVVAGPGGEFLGGDSFFDVFVEINLVDIGVTAFNAVPVPVQSLGNTQLPPEVPHTSGPIHVPLTFSDPTFVGEIIDVVHNPEPVCIYEVTCIDGPCNDCGVQLGDICTGARCPGGTCSVSVQTDCGVSTCCVVYTLVNCTVSAAPACPFGANFCPICDPTPGACCLPDGTCIVTTQADCKAQGGPGAYQGDGTTCAPPQKCCLPDGSCIDTDPTCCALVGGTPFPGLCAPPQKCCLADGSCIDTDPDCCTLAGGTPFAGLCGPVEACCFADGSCQNLDPDCCIVAGGTPDGPGLCLPPEKCCLADDTCVDADPVCCVNVLGGTPFPGLCAPVEACCFPDGTCRQLEPDCCINAGGTPDGVGPCQPIEACCLPDGTCIQAEPLCCFNVLGGTPDGVRPCFPIEACCLPDGTCIQAEPLCCTNVFGGTPDGIGPCLPLEACCFLDGTCVMADPLCCANALGGVAQGALTTCTPNLCPTCTLTSQTVSLVPANRARLTLGIGEDVTVSTVGAVVATWTVAGGGTVAPAVGASTLFTASQTPSVSTVTATLPGGVFCTRVFTVIAPTGINSAVSANPGCGLPLGPPNNNIGVRTVFNQTVLPITVSFWRAHFRENIPGEAFVWPSGAAGAHPVQVVNWTPGQNNGITDTSARCTDPIGVLDPPGPPPPVGFMFPIRVPEEYLNQAGVWTSWLPLENHPKTYTAAGQAQTSIVATNTATGALQGPWQ